jgi:hypothetical protein
MKKLLSLLLLATLLITACGETVDTTVEQDIAKETAVDTQPESSDFLENRQNHTPETTVSIPQSTTNSDTPSTPDSGAGYKFQYLAFEELLTEFATDVVVAKYVGHRPFGERKTLMEYEFRVIDRVLGNAPDRIFVYTSVEDIGRDLDALNMPGGFTGAEYLLALQKIRSVTANTHENGYSFIRGTVINLDEPSRSIMTGESLSRHSGMDFNDKSLSRETIVSHVRSVTKNNKPARDFIRSNKMEDIIKGSPHILIVEVNDDESFDSIRTDWASRDISNCTVIRTLKGSIKPEFQTTITFFADTVKPGEQYIVAVEPLTDGNYTWLVFTSVNSLFQMSQFDEIVKIIG